MSEQPDPHQTSNLLWHYTDIGGLHGILHSGTLWGTHARFLNDIRETIYGYEYIRERSAKLLGRDVLSNLAQNTDIWRSEVPTYARYFLSGVLAFGIHTSVKRINDDILTKEVGPFVTCLSEARDELSQWRGYAGDGGYAIGFDRERLAKSIKPKPRKGSPPPQTGQSLRFGPVELHMSRLVKMKYDLADEKTIDQEINDALAGLISHLERRADSSAEGPDESMTSLMNRILAIMTERKDPAFEAEREHRIITFEYPDPNMFHPKPSIGLIPRVAVEFGPESVREILVGPGGDSELRKFSVTYFVKHDPHYSHVEVKRSRVPFRTP